MQVQDRARPRRARRRERPPAEQRVHVVRVHDTAADPRYIATDAGIRSELAIPLMVLTSAGQP